MERKKLLLVDDNPENLDVLYRLLKDDYELFSANNGQRALVTAEAQCPDMILLDVMMPGMNGYEVCRRLRESDALKDVLVIFLTAMNDETNELLGFELGAVDYILKPFRPGIVKKRIAVQLALKHQTTLLLKSKRMLETSLERLKMATEAANICIWSWNFNDDRIECDERTCNFFDIPDQIFRSGITLEFLKSRLHPEDLTRVMTLLMDARRNNTPFNHEFRLLLSDGNLRHVQVACVVEYHDGVPLRMIGISRDITGQKKAEESMRTLVIAIEQSPVSVVITDLDTRVQYVNPAFTEVTGYTAEEVNGEKTKFLKSGLMELSVYQDLWQSLLQGRSWAGEFINRRKNGELFWEEAYISPVCNGEKVPTQYVAVKLDVTERKRLERELKENNDRIADAYGIIRRDLEAAARIQRDLIPQKNAQFRGFSYDWLFIPSQYVAGDTFNILQVDETAIVYYLLDVSGHGIPAALLSTTLSSILQPSPNFINPIRRPIPDPPYYQITPPRELVRELNERFMSQGDQIQYFTMIYGTLDVRSGAGSLTQAGHPPPIHQAQDGSVRLVGDGGYPVGMVPDIEYDEESILLEPGERLFIYSDGITECMSPDGTMFDINRLIGIVRNTHRDSMYDVMEMIRYELEKFRGGTVFDDDISLLVLERKTEEG